MHKLQECRTLGEAEPFLRGKTPTFRKTVETAILLRNHPNPEQQGIGDQFMAAAIRELDAAEEPAEHHGDKGIKSKGEHFVKEETLAGGDKSGTEGSEQSSQNAEPVTKKEGTTEPDGDMETPGMSTENQFNEAYPPMPGMGPPGMDPQVAQQMAPQMPQIPQMNTPQQIQQMQYTVKRYLEAYLKPVQEQVMRLTKAQAFTSNKIKEMQTSGVGLDLNKFSQENKIPKIQEMLIPSTVNNLSSMQPGPANPEARIYEKKYSLEEARQQITDIDKMISNNGNVPYQ